MSDTYICEPCLDRDHNGCQGRAWDFNDDKPCRCWCPVCREENDPWQVSAKVTVKPYDPDEWAALLAQCDDTKLATMEADDA